MSDYRKLKLYRGGEYLGYVAIYERDYPTVRKLCLEANGHIMPLKTRVIADEHGDYEHEELAGFTLEAVQEDVHLAFPIGGQQDDRP